MNLTRKNIRENTIFINKNWTRLSTPYTNDNKEKQIDSVEFEIDHKGIDRLEKNIESATEFIMCFVHFDSKTKKIDNIYLSIWDTVDSIDDKLDASLLNKEEQELIISIAKKYLKI